MELFWWSVTLVLMAIGLIGTVLPIFPGPAVIFAAAILHRSHTGDGKKHRLAEHPRSSFPYPGFLRDRFRRRLARRATFRSDALGHARGARRGRSSGSFSGCRGFCSGPVLGALAGEIIGGKQLVAAGRAGWGALLGNVAALLGKLLIALAMVSWFLVAAPAPF